MPKHPGKPERFDSARIAGWEGRDGRWRNTESGDRLPSARSLALSRNVTVAVDVVDSNGKRTGETKYYYSQRINKNMTIDDVVEQYESVYDLQFA